MKFQLVQIDYKKLNGTGRNYRTPLCSVKDPADAAECAMAMAQRRSGLNVGISINCGGRSELILCENGVLMHGDRLAKKLARMQEEGLLCRRRSRNKRKFFGRFPSIMTYRPTDDILQKLRDTDLKEHLDKEDFAAAEARLAELGVFPGKKEEA